MKSQCQNHCLLSHNIFSSCWAVVAILAAHFQGILQVQPAKGQLVQWVEDTHTTLAGRLMFQFPLLRSLDTVGRVMVLLKLSSPRESKRRWAPADHS